MQSHCFIQVAMETNGNGTETQGQVCLQMRLAWIICPLGPFYHPRSHPRTYTHCFSAPIGVCSACPGAETFPRIAEETLCCLGVGGPCRRASATTADHATVLYVFSLILFICENMCPVFEEWRHRRARTTKYMVVRSGGRTIPNLLQPGIIKEPPQTTAALPTATC